MYVLLLLYFYKYEKTLARNLFYQYYMVFNKYPRNNSLQDSW